MTVNGLSTDMIENLSLTIPPYCCGTLDVDRTVPPLDLGVNPHLVRIEGDLDALICA